MKICSGGLQNIVIQGRLCTDEGSNRMPPE